MVYMNYFLCLEFSFLLVLLIFPALLIIRVIFILKGTMTAVLKNLMVRRFNDWKETSTSLLRIIKIFKIHRFIAHLFHLMFTKVALTAQEVIKMYFFIRTFTEVYTIYFGSMMIVWEK